MRPISICTIVKNEERYIKGFLDSIKKAFKNYPVEVVIVDTGSLDNTVSIIKEYTDFPVNLSYFEWCDDFSAAKNYAVSIASNNFIVNLDCDEYIKNIDLSAINVMADYHPDGLGIIKCINHTTLDNGVEKTYTESVTRIFDRRYYHYEGIIHEQLVSNNNPRDSYPHFDIPMSFDHYGYCTDLMGLKKKVVRNNKLLLKMLEKNPEDTYIYYQLGQSYSSIKDYENAYYYYGKGLEFDVDPLIDYVRNMVVGYGYAMLELGKFDEALGYEGIYESFETVSDFLTLMGLIYLRNGMIDKAYAEFEKATKAPEYLNIDTKDSIPKKNMQIIKEVLQGA